ncbi:hypothetical protein QG37_04243 [Candidozyma auris]|nr:hypothetical protein QG37_04243 [[Candida] auris]
MKNCRTDGNPADHGKRARATKRGTENDGRCPVRAKRGPKWLRESMVVVQKRWASSTGAVKALARGNIRRQLQLL